MDEPTWVGVRVVVTGATGFLGGAVARRLVSEGALVTGTGRDAARGALLTSDGVRFVRLELDDARATRDACRDAEVVLHCGALSSPWGRPEAFLAANVHGTAHVLDACRSVRRLVHVSTPSIYHDGTDRLAVREDAVLPARAVNEYARTKLQAEALVDAAARGGLPVVTLRPRALIGPGDRTILPRVIEALRRRRLPIIGSGDTLADLTVIDNVVDALLLAATAPANVVGRKYNITNGAPVRLWDVIARLCRDLELPPPRWRLPAGAALALATAMERTHRLLTPDREPTLTRTAVEGLLRSVTLDISAARRDLGYAPRVSVDDGLDRFVAWWRAGAR